MLKFDGRLQDYITSPLGNRVHENEYRSLARCGAKDSSFDFQLWKYDELSPGINNPCKYNTVKPNYAGYRLPIPANPLPQDQRYDLEVEQPIPIDNPDKPDSFDLVAPYQMDTGTLMGNIMGAAKEEASSSVCQPSDVFNGKSDENLLKIRESNVKRRKIEEDNSLDLMSNTREDPAIKDEFQAQMDAIPDDNDLFDKEKIKNEWWWLKVSYIANGISRFFCRYCPFIDLYMIHEKNDWQTEDGVEAKVGHRENHKFIHEHATRIGHQKAEDEHQRRQAENADDLLSDSIQSRIIPREETTYNGM